MKDPLGIMGTETIFVMEGYSGRNVVEEFEKMDMFKAGMARKTYILPLINGTELGRWCMGHISIITGNVSSVLKTGFLIFLF